MLLLLLVISPVYSQQRQKAIQDWEIGLFLGGGLLSGDLVTDSNSFSATAKPAIGLSFYRNLNTALAIRGGIFYTKLSSDDAESDIIGHINRGFSQQTKLTELSIMSQWDILGNRRFRKPGHFKKIITPYIFVGIALAYGRPETNYNNSKLPEVMADKGKVEDYRIAYPIGGGLKLELSRNFSISLEAGIRPIFNDLLDGVSESGNPMQDDWYSFMGVNINYRIGKTDYDNDGLIDITDTCPGIPGNPDFGKGCPDSDGDFIIDSKDECPLVPGKRVLMGCPDLDHDGVADSRDLCPNEKGLFRFLGCPDSDKDDVIDGDDLCPNIAGPIELFGCPDTDNDGIIDKNDKCPNLAGNNDNKGCPDADGDGVSDKNDECPNIVGPINLFGCPDSDGDGVMDKNDHCPNEFGDKENDGCQGIKLADKEVILEKMKNIKFPSSKYYLTKAAKRELDEINKIIFQYPDYQIVINGYTDNIGDNRLNKRLSYKRARACYRFFIENGIKENRISFFGFGAKNPIASNVTKEGREENRRVEFELVKATTN